MRTALHSEQTFTFSELRDAFPASVRFLGSMYTWTTFHRFGTAHAGTGRVHRYDVGLLRKLVIRKAIVAAIATPTSGLSDDVDAVLDSASWVLDPKLGGWVGLAADGLSLMVRLPLDVFEELAVQS